MVLELMKNKALTITLEDVIINSKLLQGTEFVVFLQCQK